MNNEKLAEALRDKIEEWRISARDGYMTGDPLIDERTAAYNAQWCAHARELEEIVQAHPGKENEMEPIPMLLWCPECGGRHIDEGEFATKPHHTHACQHCGHCWRPALIATCGVQFLPGFKNGAAPANYCSAAKNDITAPHNLAPKPHHNAE